MTTKLMAHLLKKLKVKVVIKALIQSEKAEREEQKILF